MEITVNSSLEELFNAFIADEMWAALSYRNAAFASKGRALKFANGIFRDNSDEEFEHMEELVDMAKSLGIEVTFNLKDMVANCTTPYTELSPEEDTERLAWQHIPAIEKPTDADSEIEHSSVSPFCGFPSTLSSASSPPSEFPSSPSSPSSKSPPSSSSSSSSP